MTTSESGFGMGRLLSSWAAAQVYRRIRLTVRGIDVRRDWDQRPGVATGHQELSAGRVVDDAVGIDVSLDLAEHLGRVARYCAGLAVQRVP